MAKDCGEGEPRPWELPGGFRRDAEPHRAEVLLFLERVNGVLVAAALFVVPVALTLPFALALWWLARRDLRMMRAGRMDPRGIPQAVKAAETAGACIAASLVVIGLVAFVASLAIIHP